MDNKKCVPFVSQYSDCTDENICSGCTKCLCDAEGQWDCKSVKECDEEAQNEIELELEDDVIEKALKTVEFEIKRKRLKEAQNSKTPLVPAPKKKADQDLLLDNFKMYDPLEDLLERFNRKRRSAKKESKVKKNDTVKFYGVVDELNEDTLKSTNLSGTVEAQKVDIKPSLSRRAGSQDGSNTSLQIEFSEPSLYNQITDNKIDNTVHNDDRYDENIGKINAVFGNNTRESRDKELSKLVVNELKKGSETVGDPAAPVISNITFTPENDTFAAMVFIAGNLLNKLWHIEKEKSGTSIESEVIKHEKIGDLLELFKEPLTLKQENFLKAALSQLSSIIDNNKDIKNISICENIEEAKKILDESNDFYDDKLQREEKEHKNCRKAHKEPEKAHVTNYPITKVNTVMELIEQFEAVQKKISEIKKSPESDVSKIRKELITTNVKQTADRVVRIGERKPLNQFENLLLKITRMLYPKSTPNIIKTKTAYDTSAQIKNKLRDIYGIDLGNLTVTSKDKLVFDYLSHIEANPDCLVKNNNHYSSTRTLANVEGNILLNLSEFFKMKSLSDIIKLLDPKEDQNIHRSITSTEKSVKPSTISIKNNSENDDESFKLDMHKDKLKTHLKAILEDLIEIQNTKGLDSKNINLVEALPCIYNILNTNKVLLSNETKTVPSSDKIANIFNELKSALKLAQTRRSGTIITPRPKSAVVWERTIKSLNKKPLSKTRRNLEANKPKSMKEIRQMIEKIESRGSNTYKNYALLIEVPAGEKLVLLKTLEADVKIYIKTLEDIQESIDKSNTLTPDNILEIVEFLDNTLKHINLNAKVVNNLNKPKESRYFDNEMNSNRHTTNNNIKRKQSLRLIDATNNRDDNMKISRDLIINQLIKNRILLYLRLKEAKGNINGDINYNIAQKILIYLENGNHKIARELYKVFISQNHDQTLSERSSSASDSGSSFLKLKENLMNMQHKRPLIQFEEPKTQENPLKWLSQDHLIKQLLNIKTMNG